MALEEETETLRGCMTLMADSANDSGSFLTLVGVAVLLAWTFEAGTFLTLFVEDGVSFLTLTVDTTLSLMCLLAGVACSVTSGIEGSGMLDSEMSS